MPSLVEIDAVVLEKKSSMYFHFSLLSPFDNGHGILFEQTLIIFTSECFMSSMVELDLVILKELICEKIQIDTWTDRQTYKQ